MVKELRDKTGAGMMDCKKALVDADGDMEKAVEALRQKGIASAEKKMGRIAAEGLVASNYNSRRIRRNDFHSLLQRLINCSRGCRSAHTVQGNPV